LNERYIRSTCISLIGLEITLLELEIHIIPVERRVTFKLCTRIQLIHTGCSLIHTGCSPSYVSEQLYFLNEHIVHNDRILTLSLYVMRHWSRYDVNGALEMTFMNYELNIDYLVKRPSCYTLVCLTNRFLSTYFILYTIYSILYIPRVVYK
jgi:hypothetical protein